MTVKLHIPAGGKWSQKIAKGKLIRVTATALQANVSMLFFNANDLNERYNMPDTLKAQYTAYLTKGNILMSDNGKAMVSIVEDTVGWHDTYAGYTTRALTDERYGKTTYEQERNDWYRSGEENLTVELFRNGLTTRDLGPVLNLFSKVAPDSYGNLTYDPLNNEKGDYVTLRTEMDIVLVLSNTPNPYNQTTKYPSSPIDLIIEDAPAVNRLTDVCVQHREENKRAFENTWLDEQLTKGAV